jgi:hypothetical protein
MRRAAVVLGFLAMLATVAACGGSPPESDASKALPADETPVAGEAAAPFTNVDAEPCGSGVPVGSHWTFEIYTHCGVEWIYLDGRFWLTDPLGNLNAPAGWGNPTDAGVVTLAASDRAEYLSQGGDQVTFTPAAKSFEPPLCQ